MRSIRVTSSVLSCVLVGLVACSGSSEDTQNTGVNTPSKKADDAGSSGHQGRTSVGSGVTAADASTPAEEAGVAPQPDAGSTATTGQSLIWVWYDYPNSLASVFAHPSSFTHVSPALYQINYAYTSGVAAYWQQTTNSFDGLTTAQIASKVHAAGMKVVPLVFGGAGNNGTDEGIHDIIADSPSGTQSSFITSMVNEAVANGYDGYNLDWEVDNTQTTYATYGAALQSFLGTFKTALNAHGMQLSYDLGTWYLKQTWCSGGSGVVDLTAIGSVVDLAIIEDYASTLGTASSTCPTSLPDPQNCGTDFMSALNLMCVYVPNAAISIGFNANPSSGSNDVAGAVVNATQTYGIHNVAVWPDYNADGIGGTYVFLDANNIQPAGASWYSLLANFLASQ